MATKVIDKGWAKLKREIGLASERVVAVGVIDGGAPHPSGAGSVGEVATWNHYGTSTIPARPFITRPIDMRRPEIEKLVQRVVAGISSNKISAETGLNLVGTKLRGICVQAINAREYEPNAPS